MEVREDVCEAYNERLQSRLKKMTWSMVDHSWYMDRGRITNNWPGSTTAYWWRTRHVRPADYVWRALPETPGEVAEASLAGR
jgi:hypothetical protein